MTWFDLCDLLLLCCASSIDDSDIDTVSVLLSVTRVDVLLLSRDSVSVQRKYGNSIVNPKLCASIAGVRRSCQ
jgi:hypothetical protein